MTEKRTGPRSVKNFIPVLLLMLITVFTAGCFKGEANLTIRADGSAALKTKLLGTDFLKEAITESANELKRKDSAATVKEISEGEYKGFEVTSEFPDMKTLAEKGGDLFTRRDGEAAGIQEKKKWFYDAYAFDFYAGPNEKGNQTDNSDPESAAMMKSFLDQIRYEFCLTLPTVPANHNADRVDEGGKTLHWDLSPTLSSGGEKHMKVEFRLWNKTHIALTAAFALISLALTVLFVVLSLTSEPEKRLVKQVCAGVFTVLTLVIFAFSAWQMMADSEFTAKDSISPAYVQDKGAAK